MKNTKLKQIIGYFFVIFILLIPVTRASELARNFLEGIKFYKEEKFADAIAQFSKIADTGIKNSKLFYNLGNAYLKNNDLGNAMLWYERALKIKPDDPDLKFNYEYALSLVKDEKGEKDLPIVQILFFWKYILSKIVIQWTAIILNIIFWLILITQCILKTRRYKTLNLLLLIFSIVFTMTAFYNYYESAYMKEAIILPTEVSVRSGLTTDSTQLFVLHAGTKVKIEQEKGDSFRIYFSEGKIGWIKISEAGVI